MPHYGTRGSSSFRDAGDAPLLWSAPDAHVFRLQAQVSRLEAIAYTFPQARDRVVVVSNGFFGERVREVLLTHRLKPTSWSRLGVQAPTPGLREALKSLRRLSRSSTPRPPGITNPLEGIVEAASCGRRRGDRGRRVFAGGISLPFAKLGVDVAFSASRNASRPPGISPVAVAPSLWESTDSQTVEGCISTVHLGSLRNGVGEWHLAERQFPRISSTPSTGPCRC